jgi:hypothetical protein
MKNQLSLLIALVVASCSLFLYSACQKDTNDPIEKQTLLHQKLQHFEIVTLDTRTLFDQAQQISTKTNFSIVSTDGKVHCALQVLPNQLFEGASIFREYGAAGLETTHKWESVALSGSIDGQDFSTARLLATPEYIGGFWEKNGETYVLEPLTLYQSDATAGQFVIHKASDEIHPAGQGCATLPADASLINTSTLNIEERSPTCWKTEVRCDGDYEYYRYKANSNLGLAVFAIAVAINNADAKFAAINMDLVIPEGGVGLYTDPNAWWYYPKSGNGDQLLVQMRDFHNLFHGNTNRDTWVLFTGKDIYGGAWGYGLLGIAYVGVVCNNRPLSYAVVEWTTGNLLTNTTAHEIGHNFSAKHTEEGGCPAGTSGGGIMNAAVPGNAAAFSTCSRAQMNWHIWFNNACLTQGNCN